MKKNADLFVLNAKQLIRYSDSKGDSLEVLENGALAIKDGRILAIGDTEEIRGAFALDEGVVVDASGKVVVPGFVDCHTHLVFAGSRVDEYSGRIQGWTSEEFKKRGIKTGIMATVDVTRNATKEGLFDQSSDRLKNMILAGTTTVESKSGYGLSLESELAMLEVNLMLREAFPVRVVSTFLGAHGWPEDIPKKSYMELLKKEMIPAVAERELADFCDIWCDDGHYTAEECREILEAGLSHGLRPKIHTGAYSYIGGADLAGEMSMVSADHLNYTPRAALKKLAMADVVGVLLPGIDFAVDHPRPFDPGPMVEEGLSLALATNCCPGCWCESMHFIMSLACRRHSLSPVMALKAATLGGAMALGLDDEVGSIEVGKVADLQIWGVSRFEDVVYRLGGNVVDKVIKDGRVIVDRGILL
ncbi:MAG: imidazolonepropionase [Dethiosulfovibrio sp.]|nr:imidazolonepropionase [Dethiosulfovibrio sp.]